MMNKGRPNDLKLVMKGDGRTKTFVNLDQAIVVLSTDSVDLDRFTRSVFRMSKSGHINDAFLWDVFHRRYSLTIQT